MPDPAQRALAALEGLSVAERLAGGPTASGAQLGAAFLDVLYRRGAIDAGDVVATLGRRQITHEGLAAYAVIGAWCVGSPVRAGEQATLAAAGTDDVVGARAVAFAASLASEVVTGEQLYVEGTTQHVPERFSRALEIAVAHLDDFEAAVTTALAAGADAAIVGALVASRVGVRGIPLRWRHPPAL